MANSGTYNRTKIHFSEGSAAATPDATEVVIYAKSDGKMYSKDDAGTETLMSSGPASAAVFVGVKAYNAAGQSVTDAVLALDSEDFDSDGFHDGGGANPSRLTVPTGKDGKYIAQAGSFVDGAARLEIRVNGSNVRGGTGQSLAAAGFAQAHVTLNLVATDYVEVYGLAGVSRTYGAAGAANQTTLSLVKVG